MRTILPSPHKKLRIAQVAPLFERIPAKKYGGTERVVYALTEELVRLGHEVTLFASGDSVTSAKLVSVQPKSLREAGDVSDVYAPNGWVNLNIGLAYSMQEEFDIIHDHHNLVSLPTANLATTPVVVTVHGVPYLNPGHLALYESMSNVNYVAISNAQRKPNPNMNWAGTVHNGTLYGEYPFSPTFGNYLLFVGRISKQKGVHHAIEVAKKLNLPLIIAAKLENAEGNVEYFKEFVEPHLNDKIQWIGEVEEDKRNELMANALCFLHPVTWPEPFGLTLAESMACGCPVVAFGLGSIPEIINDGKTGFVVSTVSEMIDAVKNIKTINRYECRQHAFANFSPKIMTQGYLEVYNKILANRNVKEQLNRVIDEYRRQKPPSYTRQSISPLPDTD